MTKKLSPTQEALLERMKIWPTLERRPGGFWTGQGVPEVARYGKPIPEWWVATGTVTALLNSGILAVTRRHPSLHFATEARLASAGPDPARFGGYRGSAEPEAGAD